MTMNLEAEVTAREKNNAALIAALDEKSPSEVDPSSGLDVQNDADRGRWTATFDSEAIAELQRQYVGGRLVLLSTWITPAHRNNRMATNLVARVLDEIRESGKKIKITVICPVVGKFIARHPEYADLVDKDHPGAGYSKHEPSESNQNDELTEFERDLT